MTRNISPGTVSDAL